MPAQLFYFSGTGNTLAIAKAIAAGIGNASVEPVTKASPIVKNSTDSVGDQDKAYRVDDKCNGCRMYERVCPVSNITIATGRPVWNHSCQFCLACLHWCPQSAIQYGKAPAKRGRYHNPEIALQDMMAQQRGRAIN